MSAPTIRYADAGVDRGRAEQAKQRIARLARRTFTRGVLAEIGGFGALYALDLGLWRQPVLVTSVDGVGTKLKVAAQAGAHEVVGADIVHHCVNDIAVQGAAPLFFLDYIASSRLDPHVLEQVFTRMTPPPHPPRRPPRPPVLGGGPPRGGRPPAAPGGGRSGAARRRRCPGCTPRATTTW